MTEPEYCWFIYGFKMMGYTIGHLSYQSKGTECSVEFDWSKIFRNPKRFLGFLHTHPSGFKYPSDTDFKTMKGWVIALGRPVLCGIGCDGVTRMYLFQKKQSQVSYSENTVPFIKLFSIIIYKL